ncbi:hypothetical protein Thi970DRAFT_00544 [Thiorhodovibrio frisius]|uniref:Uncharacterized protein n=1 Tax=Thiorhodovibrio frisius TaxID=631362 RepID=H8YWS8_9GAMM|nr:hypothetical protein Thi970DRAFT_00544 [Thiorhodovibrio frisius]WPL22837.1 hypothetical protein Thiofri_03011 [Thiorhodovibrio frisius]
MIASPVVSDPATSHQVASDWVGLGLNEGSV